jgi:hypothetical protein
VSWGLPKAESAERDNITVHLHLPQNIHTHTHSSLKSIEQKLKPPNSNMSERSSRNASPLRGPFGHPSYTVKPMSVADEFHPVLHAGRVAVITGAASGIGRAAARELAK